MKKILIIQTAFIGDVILATPIIENLQKEFPNAQIDFLLRKGNESLLANHPKLNKVLVWNKQGGKYKNLLKLLKQIRKERYDLLITLQRFLSSGIFAGFSKAREIVGFGKNPLSILFTRRVKHEIGTGKHECERNIALIEHIIPKAQIRPRLYPGEHNYKAISGYQDQPYITIAPTSVWFTKQLPREQWVKLIERLPQSTNVYLLGASSDIEACKWITAQVKHKGVNILAGKLNLLQSAALMEKAQMNYVNDSAPMHLASAMNAPTTAFFCSTIPAFGFGPLSETSVIKEVDLTLKCRPCGLHGKRDCPEGHFKCGYAIDIDERASR